MKLYSKELEFIANIKDSIDEKVILNKKIGNPSVLSFTLYDLIPEFEDIRHKDIIEVEDDFFIIESIKKTRGLGGKKDVQAVQIQAEFKSLFWENSFSIVNPKPWESGERISIGLFYTNNNKYWQCLESHIAGDSFELSKFRDLTGVESNYMPNTTPHEVLQKLLQGTSWTLLGSDSFTPTDFSIKQASLYENIEDIIKTWGCEIEYKRRTIRAVKNIGENRTEVFSSDVNLERLIIDEDSSNIINKLFVYGSNGLTFEILNNKQYVENLESIHFYGEREGSIFLSNVKEPNFLLQRGMEELEKVSKLKKIIDTKAIKLSSELYNIGDSIELRDSQYFENSLYRIYSIIYNPFTNKVFDCNLGTIPNDLSSLFKEVEKNADENKNKLNDKIDNIANDDIINQVIEVVQYQTISVESAHIMNAWISNLFVERLETNSWGRDIRNPELLGLTGTTRRNFISINEQHIHFISEQLNLEETESLKINNPDMTKTDMVQVYYTAIGTDEDAYKYYTITKPSTLNAEIKPEQNHLYEVQVYKTVEIGGVKQRLNKMSLNFLESGSQEVVLKLGAGNAVTDKSSTFEMFKGENYINMSFYSNSDQPNGFNIKQTHTSVVNSNVPYGGGHIANVYYGTADPDSSLGKNGDIYIQI